MEIITKKRDFFNYKLYNWSYPPVIKLTMPPIISSIAASQAYIYINAGSNTITIAIIIPSTNIAPPLN